MAIRVRPRGLLIGNEVGEALESVEFSLMRPGPYSNMTLDPGRCSELPQGRTRTVREHVRSTQEHSRHVCSFPAHRVHPCARTRTPFRAPTLSRTRCGPPAARTRCARATISATRAMRRRCSSRALLHPCTARASTCRSGRAPRPETARPAPSGAAGKCACAFGLPRLGIATRAGAGAGTA